MTETSFQYLEILGLLVCTDCKCWDSTIAGNGNLLMLNHRCLGNIMFMVGTNFWGFIDDI